MALQKMPLLHKGKSLDYLRILDDVDRQEDFGDNPEWLTGEFIEEKLQEARERLKKYEGYQRPMEETGQSQMSLTDAGAKLMKSKNGFVVAYNAQTAVGSETHLNKRFPDGQSSDRSWIVGFYP